MNKKLTITLIILEIFFVAWYFYSCCIKEVSYPFPCLDKDIESIELFYNPKDNGDSIDEEYFCLLKTLNSTGIEMFIEEITQLKTLKIPTAPPFGFGEYFARVTYSDGDVEIYGTKSIEHIASGEEAHGFSPYYFAEEGTENPFKTIMFKYLQDVESIRMQET